MLYLRIFLSAVSLVGGHFLNRRLDRVVLIFAVLAAVAIVSYLVLPTLVFGSLDRLSMEWTLEAPAVVVLAVAIGSAVLTWIDLRQPIGTRLTAAMKLSGVILSALGLMFVILALSRFLIAERSYSASTPSSIDESLSPLHQVSRSTSFTSTHLGGSVDHAELRSPPRGPYPLRGRILLDGRPFDGGAVNVVLNGVFEAEALTTNDRGEFEILLPAGKWFINRVTFAKPADETRGRNLLLFSEFEPLLTDGSYIRHNFENATGLEVNLPGSNGVPTFILRDAISVEWPPLHDRYSDQGAVIPAADIATSIVRWAPVPGAAEYEIQLNSIERADSSMTSSSILRRRQPTPTLNLTDLVLIPRKASGPNEYAIKVFAFDANRKLLTHTDDALGEFAFSLPADVQFAEENSVGSAARARDRGEYFRNLERLSLVSGLLDYGQLEAARVILNQVTDDAPAGRRDGLQGAIEALSGNCAAALPLFDKADADGGLGCAPPKYRRLCEPR
jgi:hypothetical protein